MKDITIRVLNYFKAVCFKGLMELVYDLKDLHGCCKTFSIFVSIVVYGTKLSYLKQTNRKSIVS